LLLSLLNDSFRRDGSGTWDGDMLKMINLYPPIHQLSDTDASGRSAC